MCTKIDIQLIHCLSLSDFRIFSRDVRKFQHTAFVFSNFGFIDFVLIGLFLKLYLIFSVFNVKDSYDVGIYSILKTHKVL